MGGAALTQSCASVLHGLARQVDHIIGFARLNNRPQLQLLMPPHCANRWNAVKVSEW